MKKLLQWVLPVFLSIVPVLGAEEIGMINDPFFTKKDTAVSIRLVYESGPNVMALVDATDNSETRSKKVIAECAPNGWEMSDGTQTYKEKVIAQVICGTMLEQAYTKRQEIKYLSRPGTNGANFVGEVVVANADLRPGTKANLYDVLRFERPDNTVLEIKNPLDQGVIAQIFYKGVTIAPEDFLNEPEGTQAVVAKFSYNDDAIGNFIEELYPIIRTTQTGQPFHYSWCWKHDWEVQGKLGKFGKKEFRHAHRTYEATPTTPVIKINALEDKRVIFEGVGETLLRKLSEQEIGSGKKNESQCTPSNYESNPLYPAGYRVV